MNADSICGSPPIAVGGVGGSGTRLIAEILNRIGYYLGDDLNEANDNLWFTLLFKYTELLTDKAGDFDQAISVFRAVMLRGLSLTDRQIQWVRKLAVMDRPQHSAVWLQQRVESIIRASQCDNRGVDSWGWKEPNTHIFLDRLNLSFPEMRYIHVMRNGLDMAYSANQNQLKLWGKVFFETEDFDISPRYSLKYWCLTQRRITSLAKRMPGRFLLLNYDRFCAVPQLGLRLLFDFLNLKLDACDERALVSLIQPPSSIGRFKHHGLRSFDLDDIAYVRELGFDTSGS